MRSRKKTRQGTRSVDRRGGLHGSHGGGGGSVALLGSAKHERFVDSVYVCV